MEEENSHFEMEIACLEVRRERLSKRYFLGSLNFFPTWKENLEKLKQEKQNQ